MSTEDNALLLQQAIIETGSIREGLKLYREVTAELNGATTVAPAPSEPKPATPDKGDSHHKKWTTEDRRVAQDMADHNYSFKAIAERLGRTEGGVYNAWYSGKFDHPGLKRTEFAEQARVKLTTPQQRLLP